MSMWWTEPLLLYLAAAVTQVGEFGDMGAPEDPRVGLAERMQKRASSSKVLTSRPTTHLAAMLSPGKPSGPTTPRLFDPPAFDPPLFDGECASSVCHLRVPSRSQD